MVDKDMQRESVPLGEKLSFSTALLGQNMLYTFVNFYIMIFYTDVLGITAAAAGTLFLIARIWDSVNDPLMGVVVDRTVTRWGKCRPYLLFFPLPIAVLTALLFFVPDVDPTQKLIYAYLTYILWGMFYTAADIPIWTLSSRMSTDSGERKTLISFGRVFGAVGSVLPVLLVVPLKQSLGKGDDATGYFLTIILFSILFVPLMIQSFFKTRERAGNKASEIPTLMENIRAIASNPPLLLLQVSGLVGVLTTLPMTGLMYFTTYNLGNENYMMILAGVNLVSGAAGCALVPWLTQWISGKMLLIASSLLSGVICVAFFFIGYDNLIPIYIITFVAGFLWGIPMVLRTSMLADTIEYAQLKTGKRSEGLIFSMLTFLGKLNVGTANFVTGLVLTFSGYVPNVAQSPTALTGIFLMFTILPGIGSVITIIPILFFKLTEDEHRNLVEKLE